MTRLAMRLAAATTVLAACLVTPSGPAGASVPPGVPDASATAAGLSAVPGSVQAWGNDFIGQVTVPTEALSGATAIAAG